MEESGTLINIIKDIDEPSSVVIEDITGQNNSDSDESENESVLVQKSDLKKQVIAKVDKKRPQDAEEGSKKKQKVEDKPIKKEAPKEPATKPIKVHLWHNI